MASKTIQAATARRYASLKEAGAYVGVGERTIRDWITRGLIKGYKINARLIRVDLNELDAAMRPFGGAA
ncbi:AlpA family transcriptional regulator [Mycobacterium sp. ITM-2016-00318]|uniref:helix-turn-helix transcriptional regulator n=1 Tax=Mycobacterium sp. ITM-2016-00318 TaxID=2099693 RepID=UPI000CF96F85|nr:helix-turn-helix domain-containing protein [Mycobacterium sp. ITM-2016-00318]WNG94993.1 helix-turn-helix domain-containing protein [Mycobacterium sp. ITM-2016-00318]